MMKPALPCVSIRSARCLGTFPRQHTETWAMIGQDGGQSIGLGEQTLFVFSDTLLHAIDPRLQTLSASRPAAPANHQGIFLANCAGVSAAGELRQALAGLRYFTDEHGLPRQILTPDRPAQDRQFRFWPEHGVFIDGQVYLYYLAIQTVDARSIWGFRNLGAGLAILDPETGQCRQIRKGGDWLLWPAVADDFHFGVQVIREGEEVYVFASIRHGLVLRARLARVKAGLIADPEAYEYLTSPHPRWSPDLAEACDLGESSNEFSVSYNPYLGRFVMVYLDGYNNNLMLRTAEYLWGPYTAPTTAISVPRKPESELIYMGFEHPRFHKDQGKTVYISYCQPHFNNNMLVAMTFR